MKTRGKLKRLKLLMGIRGSFANYKNRYGVYALTTMLLPVLLLLNPGYLNAQQSWDDYRFKRKLDLRETGWYRLELPNQLFQHLQANLADLRIKGITSVGDTIEAPYLIDWPRTETTTSPEAFRIINQSRRGNTFFATLAAPEAGVINRIKLDFTQANFDWQVRLEGSTDQRNWFRLLDQYRILSFQDPNGDYQFSTLHFADAQYPYYRIAITSDQTVQLQAANFDRFTEPDITYRSYPIIKQEVKEIRELQCRQIDLRLPWPVPVAQLQLPALDTIDYYRPIRIEVLTDSVRTEDGWKYRYTQAFRGVLSSLEEPVFAFPSVRTYALRIFVTHHDNTPLSLGTPTVMGAAPVITTRITETANYVLLYGDTKAGLPRYDLVRFRDRIPETMPVIQPGPEVRLLPDSVAPGPLLASRAWLWGVMILVIGVLGWFSVGMLRKG